MNILLILTGGTIGSAVQGDSISVSDSSSYDLINRYENKYGKDVTFTVRKPIKTLSENMNPEHWNALCRELDSVNTNDFDGIIIAHGSDTLSYTSAVLGLLYSHLPIPLVLIAANYPLADERSNGIANLRGAVELTGERINGVYTVYRNNAGHVLVYLATRLLEADTYRGEFSSFGGKPLGEMKNGELCLFEGAHNPAYCELKTSAKRILSKSPEFKKDILVIRPYPGLRYSNFKINNNTAAVLHLTYHSSTVCVKNVKNSVLPFLEECKERNIPVYFASFNSLESAMYETSKELLEAGGIPLLRLSPEAAYAKLLIAVNQNEVSLDDYLSRNIFFEVLPKQI